MQPTWRWDWPHLAHLQAALDRVTRGECSRLMVFMPPRHGKSEMTTIRYPVYRMEQDPTCRVIVGSYNQEQASRFGRKSRRIAETRFPLAGDHSAVAEWERPEGGLYRSVGVGSGVTGQGAHLILIDDPIKSRKEAESLTYRDALWSWYTDDLWTRQEPDCAIILIHTRWHEDDLGGRLLAEAAQGTGEAWEVVNLPALAEEDDLLGRAPGEALCPDRYSRDWLLNAKLVEGDYSYNALYQQRPAAREGNLFKVGKLQYVDAAPADLRRARCWDIAATEGDGDYTAGVLMGVDPQGLYYVLDVARGQWGPDHRNDELRSTAESDGRAVRIRVPQDPGAAGVDLAKSLVRMLSGYSVTAVRETGDKETRADPYAAQVNAGNVRIVRGPWNRDYFEELRQFPQGAHDDQVDASSGAFSALAKRRTLEFY